MKEIKNTVRGFTLIELLVVIGIIGILAAIVLVAVNPGRNFAQTNNARRQGDLIQISNAVFQFASEHKGNFPGVNDLQTTSDYPSVAGCAEGTATEIGTAAYNLAAAGNVDGAGDGVEDPIVPTYIAGLPVDPSTGTTANTGYFTCLDTGTGRISFFAPDAELGVVISVER